MSVTKITIDVLQPLKTIKGQPIKSDQPGNPDLLLKDALVIALLNSDELLSKEERTASKVLEIWRLAKEIDEADASFAFTVSQIQLIERIIPVAWRLAVAGSILEILSKEK
jgi:hypothetical protein